MPFVDQQPYDRTACGGTTANQVFNQGAPMRLHAPDTKGQVLPTRLGVSDQGPVITVMAKKMQQIVIEHPEIGLRTIKLLRWWAELSFDLTCRVVHRLARRLPQTLSRNQW